MSLQPGAVSQGSVWRLLWECKTLEKIDLPDSIQQIGNRAFRRCKMLADIHFPANLKDIGEETFYFCAANELQLPKKVEFIADGHSANGRSWNRCALPGRVYSISEMEPSEAVPSEGIGDPS